MLIKLRMVMMSRRLQRFKMKMKRVIRILTIVLKLMPIKMNKQKSSNYLMISLKTKKKMRKLRKSRQRVDLNRGTTASSSCLHAS